MTRVNDKIEIERKEKRTTGKGDSDVTQLITMPGTH
jgi:hypothetical protein